MTVDSKVYIGGALAFFLLLGRIIYLRYFHPLAKIPGPFLASLTQLYRFYYDYISNGSYYLQFEGFRAKYEHRQYRAILNPFFSRRSVLAQEGIVREKYMFGAPWNSLDREDLGGWFNMLARTTVVPMMKLTPFVSGMMDMLEAIEKDVEKVVDQVRHGIEPEKDTIYHTHQTPPTVQLMVDEGFGFLGAASETAGNAMTMCAFYTLRDATVHAALHKELLEAFPDPTNMDFLALEKLPYLTAVVKEGTRLSYGVLHPLPRVVPETTVFNGHILEKGVTVSMCSWLLHRDPTAFPNPTEFQPERWLSPTSDKPLMDKYFPLAMCEVYVAVGRFFRRFGPGDLEPLRVGPEDFAFEDYFGAFRPTGARDFTVLRAKK
ncbi:cytochrome P450 [Lasiosphaeris hirsuta]|uniref:Cytochrome P450 n=1 Tax=Lasiosphaeris hirsuta TaxID=260670 RepID=A0AA39ZVS3_9PEZI|nr:cytochrome P450 [Lasiosphaeris hirsuta]